MATPTYTPIQTYTVSGTSTTYLDFSSISGYTDLFLSANFDVSANASIRVQFNSDTSSNYYFNDVYGNGSAVASTKGSNQTAIYLGDVRAGQRNTTLVNFMNYANSSVEKTILCRNNNNIYIELIYGIWANNNAVNTIRVLVDTGYFVAGSTFTLYGIANAAIGAPKATGGIITYDNDYYYHTFGASGTFTPQQSLTADILVVAGGGGGSSAFAGGGGAGGLLGFASQSLSATNYTVTVGAGGAGGANNANTTPGSTGSDSQFGALTLVKGGGGAQAYESNSPASDANGGSGAGSTYRESSRSNRDPYGTGTSGQGNRGGSNNYLTATYGSGGGGGAGAVGANGNTSTDIGGNGGDGSSAYSSWGLVTGTGQNVSGTVYYAGGGAGGGGSSSPAATRGGYGGGGNSIAGSSSSTLAQSGAANTGGGGAGGSYGGGSGAGGGSGGSGIVIVRYPKA